MPPTPRRDHIPVPGTKARRALEGVAYAAFALGGGAVWAGFNPALVMAFGAAGVALSAWQMGNPR